jgi:hypothetical protein
MTTSTAGGPTGNDGWCHCHSRRIIHDPYGSGISAETAALFEAEAPMRQLRLRMVGRNSKVFADLEGIRIAGRIFDQRRAVETADGKVRKPAPPLERLSASQAAELAGVSRQAVTKAGRAGRLPGTRDEKGRWSFSRPDVERWRVTRR